MSDLGGILMVIVYAVIFIATVATFASMFLDLFK